jgi:hypothetical protein
MQANGPAICFGWIAGLSCWAKGESELPFRFAARQEIVEIGAEIGAEIGGNFRGWKSVFH